MRRKNLVLAASITMLIAVPGLASARAAGSYTRNWTVTTGHSDQQVRRALTTPTVEPNAHRYHGGPKSND
jgi:hypothetical protein